MTHLVLGFAVEGNAPPPKKITSWFLSKGQGKTRDDSADYIPHDIYVIGTQEDPLGEGVAGDPQKLPAGNHQHDF